MRVRTMIVATSLSLLAACEQPRPLASACKGAEVSTAKTERRPESAKSAVEPSGTLGERLALEASSRPQLTVSPERLAAALKADGVEVVRTKQVLASPVGARYCALLATARGSSAAVCEFADEQSAQRGERTSHERFDSLIPNRELTVRANALLTLTAQDREEARRIREVFARLTPHSLASL